MPAKGKNQHVLPDGEGWCVIDEVNQMLVLHFSSREEAMAHANAKAVRAEGSVLIHTNQCHVGPFSSVSLPQEHMSYSECNASPQNLGRFSSDFDPFLGFDEYYFEI
jgi:hypothetical protein